MSEQERKVKRPKEPPKGEEVQGKATVTEKGKKIKEDLDNLMDEIDEILEENAEEFVRNYVQRGGE
ncbi:MAG: ubiquitin-like protein Pup [candidate division NC10 bacterium]|jgi:ubiquitin-like protein Pup|nr:ubiquitin-like protein Pup [candidate division NC10 bacterium]